MTVVSTLSVIENKKVQVPLTDIREEGISDRLVIINQNCKNVKMLVTDH